MHFRKHVRYNQRLYMIKTKIIRKHADEAIAYTARIIEEFGPRLCGTDSCKKSAYRIKGEMERYCDSSGIEEFDVRPKAFLGFLKASVILYLASSLLLFFGYLIPAALGYTLAVVMTITQFVFYLELFDPFYKKKKGCNVYGVIEPEGEVKQQILISGHHDSAHIFNFFTRFRRLYRIRIILGFLPVDLAFILAWCWVIMHYGFGFVPVFADIFRYGSLIAIIFTGQLYFFISSKGSPGAGDNLIASAIALKTAEVFSKKKNRGKAQLKNTRLVLLSFDGEEAGLRGARAYAKKHKEELISIPTYNLNLDSIYDVSEIKFLRSDINGFVKLSRGMAKECAEITASLGYTSKPYRMEFGAGATDAAELAKIGVEATTLIAMTIDLNNESFCYHTGLDTVDKIQPEAVEAVLKIVHAYVTGKDKNY
jgi:aminopeptidase YwaD